jgi:hypothetical protein
MGTTAGSAILRGASGATEDQQVSEAAFKARRKRRCFASAEVMIRHPRMGDAEQPKLLYGDCSKQNPRVMTDSLVIRFGSTSRKESGVRLAFSWCSAFVKSLSSVCPVGREAGFRERKGK